MQDFQTRQKKSFDIIFYYPQYFNRSDRNSNPFFDDLVEECIKLDCSYKVIEEPVKNSNYIRNKTASKFDMWFYLVIILRKILPNYFFGNSVQKDIFIGRIISVLSGNIFQSKVYITISNAMINVLLGLNKNGLVFDHQHGIIYDSHPGYFNENGELQEWLRHKRIGFLLFGKGFKDIFIEAKPQCLTPNNIKIVGHLINNGHVGIAYHSRKVVYTLTLTDTDLTKEQLEKKKASVDAFITTISDHLQNNNLSLVIKPHPRFTDSTFLEYLSLKFPFLSVTNLMISDLVKDCFVHLSDYSTSIFEFSLNRIPSFIVDANPDSLFYNKFSFPLTCIEFNKTISNYLLSFDSFKRDADLVYDWATKYYNPFNKNVIATILERNAKF